MAIRIRLGIRMRMKTHCCHTLYVNEKRYTEFIYIYIYVYVYIYTYIYKRYRYILQIDL